MSDNAKALIDDGTKASVGMSDGIPLSTIIVGIICLIPVIYIAIADHLIGIVPAMMSIDPLTVPGLTTFGPLFILAIIVRPIGRLFKVKGFLSKKDMVIIYVMAYVGTAVAMTLSSTIVTSLMGLQERALYNAPHVFGFLLDEFSNLIIPKGEGIVEGFWLGGPSVPWGAWVIPAILWSLYILALTGLGLLFVAMVRKQWNEREHLTFPMNKPVLVLAGDPSEDEELRAFWKNKVMWLGFSITAIYMLYEFLSQEMPMLPPLPNRNVIIPKTLLSLGQGIGPDLARIFNATDTQVWVVFWIFGLGYFVGSNVLFSTLLFWILRKCGHYVVYKTGLFNWWSVRAKTNYMSGFDGRVGTGAAMAMAVYLLWLARHDIKAIFSSKRGEISDDGLNHRSIVTIGLVSLIFIAFFELVLLHKGPILFIVRTLMWLLAMVGTVRVRAEAGSPVLGLPFGFSYSWIYPGIGTKAIGGPVGAAGNILTYHMDLQQYAPVVAIWTGALEGYNLADEAGFARPHINRTVVLSVIATCIIFFLMGLPMVYNGRGALFIMPGSSPKSHLNQAWNPVADIIRERADLYPPGPQLWAWIPIITGAVVASFVFSMGLRYAWWPFNVAGYIIANTQPFDRPMVFALSCAWVVKSLVFRYGGNKLYRRLMPFFLGFALGELTINFLRPFLKLIFFA
jgi:hypothetical protein